MSKGTEAFPNLGEHCAESDCHQLDFLPFTCDCCQQVFCLEHRSYKAHKCPKAEMKDTSVVICSLCQSSVRKVYGESIDTTLSKHSKTSSCDRAKICAKRKCPVKRCREVLTFSNTYHCKSCHLKTCLSHRFPTDHQCKAVAVAKTGSNHPLLKILAERTGTDCSSSNINSKGKTSPRKVDRDISSMAVQAH